MSEFPVAPGHGVPNVPLRPEHAQGNQDSRDADPDNSLQCTPTSKNSPSLLSQAFAASSRQEQQQSETAFTRPSDNGPPRAPSIHPIFTTNLNAPQNKESNSRAGTTDDMAMVSQPLPMDFRSRSKSQSLGSTPIRPHSIFDTVHLDALLSNHHQFFSKTKGRGTSLERTSKEKAVQAQPKGSFSTNPGDTGMKHPSTLLDDAKESIDVDPPMDDVRAKYRQWRDARPSVSIEKPWSIGEQGSDSGHGGQVEKSIAEALAGIEPNSRSRKASHGLRLFKEGLPEEQPKKKESRGRARSKEGSSRSKGEKSKLSFEREAGQGTDSSTDIGNPLESIGSASGVLAMSTETTLSPTDESFVQANATTLGEGHLRPLPAQLLSEIRNHNITGGSDKGSSFSRSIPVTVSEKERPDATGALSASLETIRAIDDEYQGEELSQIRSTDDDDDSGEEQISSALFVPHKTKHESAEGNREDQKEGPERLQRPADCRSASQEWLEEHEVPTRDINKFDSIDTHSVPPATPVKSSSPRKGCLLPDAQDSRLRGAPGVPEYPAAGDIQVAIDDVLTSKKDVDQFTINDKLIFESQLEPKKPLQAIELIPYKHQVGGHTTMWRFSKRAVCKQLNNRENEFYEKVERYHPKLLKFLPRYIGVLNVTFEKQRKPKKEVVELAAEQSTSDPFLAGDAKVDTPAGNTTVEKTSEQPRVISQSLHASKIPVPTVTFADNRHIIPSSFLQPQPIPRDAEQRLKHNTIAAVLARKDKAQSQPPLPSADFTFRPTLSDKHAVSWGATTVNRDLRYEVFGEAFLQNPIPIRRHKKPGDSHRSPSKTHLRRVESESGIQAAQKAQQAAKQPQESMVRNVLKSAAEKSGLTALTPLQPSATSDTDMIEEADVEFDQKAGTSAPEADISQPPPKSNNKGKRRYSSGGLRRRPTEVADERGNLQYFEEADDAGYKGDVEEDVFAMDPEPKQIPAAGAAEQPFPTLKALTLDETPGHRPVYGGSMLPAPVTQETPALDIPRPVNPKEAQTQSESRVEFFLLLEDLTAGMKKPCIMDLKMGTRQYGIDANEKKQQSQSRKCASTTSKELGVRVCGLQVWDVPTQKYIFQDKYFGRDLKVGKEFQDALMRFLYDGVDYTSVLRHIPIVVRKLSELEVIIQGLPGYRFYAASLLMFYDGDTSAEDESDSNAFDVERRSEIDFKIADFANGVIKEDNDSSTRPCPPRHPDSPDLGFLRGLKSLKEYFLAIEKDVRSREMGEKRSAGLREAESDDEGNTSY